MFIKKLHRNVFDVFMGQGYNNWSRVKRTHYGVSVVAGQRLPHSLLREVAHKCGT